MVARGSGMHHFTDESLLGAPLTAAVDVPEYLLELNVLPNRPDFLGLIGIAREVAALLRLTLRYPDTYQPAAPVSRYPSPWIFASLSSARAICAGSSAA